MPTTVEWIERLRVRAGSRLIAIYVRPRSDPSQVVLQYSDESFKHSAQEIYDSAVFTVGKPEGNPRFLEQVAQYFARVFGFTAVLEHADP